MTDFRPVSDTICSRYARREGGIRSDLRLPMNAELPCLSGIGGRKMRWTLGAYYKFVFLALRIKPVGWPHDVPFMNLSRITILARIAALWETGRMHFAPVSDDEYHAALDRPESCAHRPLHLGFAPHLGRCDIKKRKHLPKKDPLDLRQGRYVRNGRKLARCVLQMAEA